MQEDSTIRTMPATPLACACVKLPRDATNLDGDPGLGLITMAITPLDLLDLFPSWARTTDLAKLVTKAVAVYPRAANTPCRNRLEHNQ